MHQKKTIFLVGARASGKTTVGKALALALGWPFVDTDHALTAPENSTIAQMVECHGWEYFRTQEGKCLRQVTTPHTVIATGGGMVLAPENRQFMHEAGTVFYLHAPAPLLAARLAARPVSSQRPSLTGRALDQEVEEVLQMRDPLYRDVAHHVLNAARPPKDSVAAALAYLRE